MIRIHDAHAMGAEGMQNINPRRRNGHLGKTEMKLPSSNEFNDAGGSVKIECHFDLGVMRTKLLNDCRNDLQRH